MFGEARLGRAVHADNALPLVAEISSSVARNPGALISLARLKSADEYTFMHSVAVCALMIALARQFGLDEDATRVAGLAGLMHDLGKAAVPLDILNKPGRLTDQEFTVVRQHPRAGHDMLLEAGGAHEVLLDVVLHHHEKLDGSGYPDRLSGDAISRYAKMGAVCDVYDAVTSNRPYKAGWEPSESLRRMAEWQGHFDPLVFQAFVRSVGIYPIGSLVRMESDRLGIVIEQHPVSLVTPTVKLFYSAKSRVQLPIEIVDLSKPGCHDRIVGREDPRHWGLEQLHRLWAGG